MVIIFYRIIKLLNYIVFSYNVIFLFWYSKMIQLYNSICVKNYYYSLRWTNTMELIIIIYLIKSNKVNKIKKVIR